MTAPDLSPANYPAEPPAVDVDRAAALPGLRDLITATADAYAAAHDHVVVLDDVVAEAIAAKVWDAYIGGGS